MFFFLRGFALALVLGVSTAGVAALLPGQAAAQDSPTPVILVVDVQQVMRNSTAVQSLQQDLEQRRSRLEADAQQREEALREENQALSRQRTVLSAEAFAERRQDLEERYAQFQWEFADKFDELEELYAEGVGQVELGLLQVADEIAAERGANMVIPKSTLLLVHQDFEVTEEVMRRLNERVPAVTYPAE